MSDKSISHAISGGISGLISMAVTYPLVTLSTNAQAKTKNQQEETTEEERSANIDANDDEDDATSTKSSVSKLPLRTVHSQIPEGADDIAKSKLSVAKAKLLQLLKKLVHRLRFLIQNSKKYYSGLESALLGIVAVNFIYYYVYNLAGNYFKKLNKSPQSAGLNVKESLLTGLAAGIISRVVTNPIWVANTRMTVKQKMDVRVDDKEEGKAKKVDVSQQNTFRVMYEILQKEGVRGLTSGLGPALILVASPMIQFTVYEQLKNLLTRLRREGRNGYTSISSVEALILGSFGKLIAILATYPYYTIRSRMHLSTSNENSFKVLYGVVQNEGIGALYGGLNAKLLQSVASAGLIFYFKEEMMNLVGAAIQRLTILSKESKVFRG